MKRALVVATLLFTGFAHAEYKNAEAFCQGINLEAKKKAKTTEHSKAISGMATPLMAKADCATIKKYTEKGWVMIDARDRASRKSTGSFPGTVKLISDHHDATKHQFTEAKLMKKLSKHFKKKGRKVASLADMKASKVILFCNGLTCYRSSWAACSMHKMGFDKSNLMVVLDGYDGIKKECLK